MWVGALCTKRSSKELNLRRERVVAVDVCAGNVEEWAMSLSLHGLFCVLIQRSGAGEMESEDCGAVGAGWVRVCAASAQKVGWTVARRWCGVWKGWAGACGGGG